MCEEKVLLSFRNWRHLQVNPLRWRRWLCGWWNIRAHRARWRWYWWWTSKVLQELCREVDNPQVGASVCNWSNCETSNCLSESNSTDNKVCFDWSSWSSAYSLLRCHQTQNLVLLWWIYELTFKAFVGLLAWSIFFCFLFIDAAPVCKRRNLLGSYLVYL